MVVKNNQIQKWMSVLCYDLLISQDRINAGAKHTGTCSIQHSSIVGLIPTEVMKKLFKWTTSVSRIPQLPYKIVEPYDMVLQALRATTTTKLSLALKFADNQLHK